MSSLSTPKDLWDAYDSYTDSGQWCKLDQVRLISLDFMFRRYLAFHRNHLSFEVSDPRHYTQWLPPYSHDMDKVAFSTQVFGKDKSYVPARDTQFARMETDLAKLSSQNEEFLWIHMADLRCLDKVVDAFKLHKYAQRFFTDLR
jgi:hypothetical protein